MRRSKETFVALAACVSCATSAPRSPALDASPPRDSRAMPDVVRDVAADAPSPVFIDPERRAKLASAFPRIDERLREAHEKSSAPALAFGVVVDGELAFARGYGQRDLEAGGEVDDTTVFRIGSITKVFTALAAQCLAEEGRMALDAPAERYLPELATLRYPTADSPPLTARQLMTHTSGLPIAGGYSDTPTDVGPTEEAILGTLPGFSLAYVPGTAVRYSNLGFALLGVVVGRAADRPFRDYVDEAILRPLAMNQTVWDEEDVQPGTLATAYAMSGDQPEPVDHWRLGAGEGSGGLYSSVRDMARFAAHQLDAWPPRSEADLGPVSRAAVRASHRPSELYNFRVTGSEPTSPEVFGSSVGFGWWVHRDCDFDDVVVKTGGMEGYRSVVVLLPHRGVAVIGLTNSRYDLYALSKEVTRDLLATGGLAKRAHRPSAKLVERAKAVAALLEEYEPTLYEQTFVQAFLDQVSEAQWREWMQWQRDRLGACEFDRMLEASAPDEGAWLLRCERGFRRLNMGLASASDPRFSELAGEAIVPLAAPRERALEALLADPKASVERCERDLPGCEAVRSALARLELDETSCVLGPVRGGDGESQSAYDLRCGSRPLVLAIRLDEGRVVRARARDAAAAARCD